MVYYNRKEKNSIGAKIIATLNALAEPNRLKIVELLRNSPLTVGEITERLGILQPQTSKHLRVLSQAGLVDVQAIANRRIYRLRLDAFQALDDWLENYRRIWEERFDNLENYLQKMRANENEQSKN
ncbi:ArsR/SmtB family transcription factor [Brevibacillus ginsengisoli]|uniref:ArsR/SmtB family transcription factor n=1 Tax=Brevibacillus ginsengisoli TaxID=363854 RepID=UPI003CEC9064